MKKINGNSIVIHSSSIVTQLSDNCHTMVIRSAMVTPLSCDGLPREILYFTGPGSFIVVHHSV